MNQEVNVLALVKGKERYVFLYTAENREEICESFGRYASDPELSFTWYDAAVLTQKTLREKRESDLLEARRQMRQRASRRRSAEDDAALFRNMKHDLFDDADSQN